MQIQTRPPMVNHYMQQQQTPKNIDNRGQVIQVSPLIVFILQRLSLNINTAEFVFQHLIAIFKEFFVLPQNSTSRIVYSTHAQQSGLAAVFPDYQYSSPNAMPMVKQRPSRPDVDPMNQSMVGSSTSSSTTLADQPQTSATSKHVASEPTREDKMDVRICFEHFEINPS